MTALVPPSLCLTQESRDVSTPGPPQRPAGELLLRSVRRERAAEGPSADGPSAEGPNSEVVEVESRRAKGRDEHGFYLRVPPADRELFASYYWLRCER